MNASPVSFTFVAFTADPVTPQVLRTTSCLSCVVFVCVFPTTGFMLNVTMCIQKKNVLRQLALSF